MVRIDFTREIYDYLVIGLVFNIFYILLEYKMMSVIKRKLLEFNVVPLSTTNRHVIRKIWTDYNHNLAQAKTFGEIIRDAILEMPENSDYLNQ